MSPAARRYVMIGDLENPESVPRREASPEVRQGGKVVEIEWLRRGKGHGGER